MPDANLFLVLSNPVEGRENDYNDWYENVHLRDVLTVPGVVAAQRYAAAATPDEQLMPSPPQRYLAVYELDRDPTEVLGSFLELVGSGQLALSDALDLAGVSMHVWTPCGVRQFRSSTTATSAEVTP